ncbi:MAG: hypothetical protein K2Q18_05260, partial [Bdellovibrionales bacterium]|nr:hypothetical protein [Bdellovibrionales bacterium]
KRVEEYLKDYTIVTSLVQFPVNPPGDNDYLLIYSVINKLTNKELLITAFPINQGSYDGIVDSKNLGADQKIQVRYNAYLGDLGQNLKGIRKLIKK